MKNNGNILELYKDLTPEQLEQFNAQIVPTLQALRDKIVNPKLEEQTKMITDYNDILNMELSQSDQQYLLDWGIDALAIRLRQRAEQQEAQRPQQEARESARDEAERQKDLQSRSQRLLREELSTLTESEGVEFEKSFATKIRQLTEQAQQADDEAWTRKELEWQDAELQKALKEFPSTNQFQLVHQLSAQTSQRRAERMAARENRSLKAERENSETRRLIKTLSDSELAIFEGSLNGIDQLEMVRQFKASRQQSPLPDDPRELYRMAANRKTSTKAVDDPGNISNIEDSKKLYQIAAQRTARKEHN